MRVAIVGAGMCGLAAARTLSSENVEVVLFEKNKRVGGRVTTYAQDGFTWDTGATTIAPRGHEIEQVMLHELDTTDLVQVEKPVYLHKALRISAGDRRMNTPRYTYRTGNAKLPAMLAAGFDVRLNREVEEIERVGSRFRVHGELFDAVILTPPVPRASQLLWTLDESRPMAGVFYRACINVALGYSIPLSETPYYALLDPDQRHPLTWLTLESTKSPGRAPENGSAVCIQFSPEFSLDSYQHADESLISTAVFFMSKLYGIDFESPVSSTVKRWKYSQPESYVSIDEANPEGTRLYIASDALLGGHTEDAYEVGTLVARRLLRDFNAMPASESHERTGC